MKEAVKYNLNTDDGIRGLTIEAAHQLIPGTNVYATGVFSISEGKTDLGDIVFDDHMREWEYTSMGNLSHDQARQIALFIKNNIKLNRPHIPGKTV